MNFNKEEYDEAFKDVDIDFNIRNKIVERFNMTFTRSLPPL